MYINFDLQCKNDRFMIFLVSISNDNRIAIQFDNSCEFESRQWLSCSKNENCQKKFCESRL